MKRRLIVAVIMAATGLFCSCSLLKVTVDMGDKPLSEDDSQTRLITRGFYYDMTTEIVDCADSIIRSTHNPDLKIRALRWKIQATKAAFEVTMQSIPQVSLIDTWIFVKKMNIAFETLSDEELFFEFTPYARGVSRDMLDKMEYLACSVTPLRTFEIIEEFVELQCENYDPRNGTPSSSNTTLAWTEFLKSRGLEYKSTVGTIAEVIADLGDKIEAQSRQIGNTINWSKDVLVIEYERDTTHLKLMARLDSLDSTMRRLTALMEQLPTLSDRIGVDVRRSIWQLNGVVDNAFVKLNGQRDSMQIFVDAQRQQLISQTELAADQVVQRVMDRLPGLLMRLGGIAVAVLVVLIGVPLWLGVWIGRLSERERRKKRGHNIRSSAPESKTESKTESKSDFRPNPRRRPKRGGRVEKQDKNKM